VLRVSRHGFARTGVHPRKSHGVGQPKAVGEQGALDAALAEPWRGRSPVCPAHARADEQRPGAGGLPVDDGDEAMPARMAWEAGKPGLGARAEIERGAGDPREGGFQAPLDGTDLDRRSLGLAGAAETDEFLPGARRPEPGGAACLGKRRRLGGAGRWMNARATPACR
jgi:hypothetical protein